MEDENELCKICYEQFNNKEKSPKKMPCCSNIICLSCLEDIYKRNNGILKCPLCRAETNNKPKTFESTNLKDLFKNVIFCARCKAKLEYDNIFVCPGEQNIYIKCFKCSGNAGLSLEDYLSTLVYDVRAHVDKLGNKDLNILIKLNDKILIELDELYHQIRSKLAAKIVQVMLKNFEDNLRIDLVRDNEQNMSFSTELINFQNNLGLFLKDKELFLEKNADGIQSVLKSINFCYHNFGKINYEIQKNKKFNEFIKGKNLIRFKNESAISDIIDQFAESCNIYMNSNDSDNDEAKAIKKIFSNNVEVIDINQDYTNERSCNIF